jgi:hypothetical protein
MQRVRVLVESHCCDGLGAVDGIYCHLTHESRQALSKTDVSFIPHSD